MWRLVPVFCLFLLSCTAGAPQSRVDGEDASDRSRVVGRIELPLGDFEPGAGETPRKAFFARGVQGWLDAAGDWRVEIEVRHGHLLCGAYATGIQLGRGSPACTTVEWLTEADFLAPMQHCNSAARLHSGSGAVALPAQALEQVSCVRVLVRCKGLC